MRRVGGGDCNEAAELPSLGQRLFGPSTSEQPCGMLRSAASPASVGFGRSGRGRVASSLAPRVDRPPFW